MTKEMEEAVRRESDFWRQVLDRVINVTLTLAMSNLPFRAHDEHDESKANRGNCLSFITLLAKYDPVLDRLLSMPQGTVKYLSPPSPIPLFKKFSHFCSCKRVYFETNLPGIFSKPRLPEA